MFAVLSFALMGAAPTQPSTIPECTPEEGNALPAFRETAPHTYEVTPPKKEQEPRCYLTKARIVPAFREGKGIGLKLFSLQPDSMYARAGLRNGDVVLSLNGLALSPAQQALDTYAKVKDAPRIEADVERDGQRIRITYNVVRDARR